MHIFRTIVIVEAPIFTQCYTLCILLFLDGVIIQLFIAVSFNKYYSFLLSCYDIDTLNVASCKESESQSVKMDHAVTAIKH